MKPATESPQSMPGTVETVTRRRVIPAGDPNPPKEKPTPEFWSYLEALKPADWERHLLYIYRREGETGPMPQLEKSTGYLLLPTGERVFLSGREETEAAIIEKYGGGTYRLILKHGSERVCETRITAEGPRKANYSDGPTVTTIADGSPIATIARDAMHTMAGQDRSAYDVATRALESAASVVQRISAPPATPPVSENDQMFRALMLRMMERMMAPAPDPLDQLTKMLAVMRELGLGGGGGAGSPATTRILDVALERLLSPVSTAPAQSASAELVRSLPGVAAYVAQGIQEWRVGVEAQRDTAKLMRGAVPAQAAPGTIIPPAAPGAPKPPASAGGPTVVEGAAGAGGAGTPSLEFVETRIMQILREPGSAAEAADKTLEFLDTLGGGYVEQLNSLGANGLVGLFQQRPILRPALTNLARLREFIQFFLQYVAENNARAELEAAAAPPVPPPSHPGAN